MNKRISTLEEELSLGNPIVYFTVGDSMEPLLYNKRTRVVLVKAKNELNAGDLPLYKRPTGQLVLHRIIRTDKKYYYTRGDNRCGLEKVPKEWVLGMVTEIYRNQHHFSVTNLLYRLYVRTWNLCYPVRWTVYHIRSRIKRK